MAAQVMRASMVENKKNVMHPFFSKPAKPVQPAALKPIISPNQPADDLSKTTSQPTGEAPQISPDVEPVLDKSSRNSKANIKAKRAATSTPTVSSVTDATVSLEIDPNAGRRKRQKREPVSNEAQADPVVSSKSSKKAKSKSTKDDLLWKPELEAAAASAADDPVEKRVTQSVSNGKGETRKSPALKIDNTTSGLEQRGTKSAHSTQSVSVPAVPAVPSVPAVPAVKLLRLNPKTGTIGSPPKKPAKPDNVLKGKALEAKSEVKPEVKHTSKKKSLIVVLKYGQDAESRFVIGRNIDRILQTPPKSSTSEAPKASQTKPLNASTISESLSKKLPDVVTTSEKVSKVSNSCLPAKTTHPFFLGKAAPSVNSKISSSVKNDTVAVGPPESFSNDKLATISLVSPTKTPRPMVDFTVFGKSEAESTTKVLGAVAPAWPWQGAVHIRGRGKSKVDSLPPAEYPAPKSERKSKNSAIQVLADEDVLIQMGKRLSIKIPQQTANLNHYENPPKVLRLPTHHFRSGREVQWLMRSQIRSKLPRGESTIGDDESSEDEIHIHRQSQAAAHPVISSVYRSIASSLSAFDRNECETQSWSQKYTPSSAEEVLQSGPEAMILRDWLQNLIVKLVDTGLAGSRNKHSEKGPSKKKKKTGKDSFVVSTDDEADDLAEISEPDEFHLRGVRSMTQKTVVRSGDLKGKKGSYKLKNALVISGDSGCGKTAAVHAVAKELNFEIFEINPGSRRSGKDILERVGDMTRNHLVHRPMEDAQPALDDEMQSVSDALDRDLKSGRQGTMNSFFKTNPVKSTSKTAKAKTSSPKPAKPIPKQQKQSLILIEEADILYDEDKQFWTTVLTLIAQSKRPVIITCNDESVIPLQTLALHAILRFTPAPLDLATDYMLLVAANEGHILRRKAVKALYESRSRDLRGSLTELQFWCQFAVGDPKNGINWRYDRWPIGRDRDSHGNVLRTFSERTYDTGMGWLSRDSLEENQSLLDVEEETLRQAWDGWTLDAGNWHETLNLTEWAQGLQSDSKCKADEKEALNIYEHFVDSMSTADICAGNGFATGHKILLDTTTPELPEKARNDFTLGHELLHANDVSSHNSLGKDTSFWMKSRAREIMKVDQLRRNWNIGTKVNQSSESRTVEQIRRMRMNQDNSLTRRDLSIAFDPIAESEERLSQIASSLEPSVFDRTIGLIVLDIAPYVRSIVSHDLRLQQERLRQSNLVSAGGRSGKRKLRTTRASNAALSGGARKTTRPEKYFGNSLNTDLVLRTGQRSWQDAISLLEERPSSAQEGSVTYND